MNWVFDIDHHHFSLVVEGFRLTQRWTAVGSIAVGIAAIITSAIFNVKTLNRSAQTLALAEQRRPPDRNAVLAATARWPLNAESNLRS